MRIRLKTPGGGGGVVSTSGITIGDAVASGVNNSILYVDSSGNLAGDANLTWDTQAVVATGADPSLTLTNTDAEDAAGGRQSYLAGNGFTLAGVEHQLGRIEFSHDSIASDQEGQLRVYLNDGNDGTTATGLALLLGENAAFSNLMGVGAEHFFGINDTNTLIQLNADIARFDAGGVTFLYLNETTQDIVDFNPGSNDIDFVIRSAVSDAFFVRGSDGNVGIGTTAPGAQLHTVAGSATTIGAIIQGAAAQTANLTEWQKSDGTVYAKVNNLGQLILTTNANYHQLELNASAGGFAAMRLVDATATNTIGMLNGKLVLTNGPYNNSPAYIQFSTSGHGASIHGSDSSNLYGQGNINAEVPISAAYPAFQALMRGVSGATEIAYSVVSGASYDILQSALYYNGAAVFNEQGNDADFRVEGDTDANLLFVDASTDKVGFGTNLPTEKLSVVGNILLGEHSATPAVRSLLGQSGLGTDIAGAALNLAGGKGTGNAAGGDIVFQTSDAGASGTTLQTLATRLTIAVSDITAAVDVKVPDEVYGVGWNGSLEVPTKNAVYDEMETKQDTGNYITALTGGVTASGPGSVAATVVTNANLTGPITSVGNATSVAAQTGTGTTFAMGTSPVFTTDITTPLVIGGTATTSDLSLKTTSGVGTTGADMHFLVGNNGATEAITILNSGSVGINEATPIEKLDLEGTFAYKNASSATVLSGNTSVAVTFPVAFASAPQVVATAQANVSWWITNITTTGCTINIGSAAGTAGVVISYIAVRSS